MLEHLLAWKPSLQTRHLFGVRHLLEGGGGVLSYLFLLKAFIYATVYLYSTVLYYAVHTLYSLYSVFNIGGSSKTIF